MPQHSLDAQVRPVHRIVGRSQPGQSAQHVPMNSVEELECALLLCDTEVLYFRSEQEAFISL